MHTNVIDSMIGRKEVQCEGQDTYILYLQLSVNMPTSSNKRASK